MKILISAPDFYNYQNSIANAFRKKYCETTLLQIPDFHKFHKFQIKMLWLKKIKKEIKSDGDYQKYQLELNSNLIKNCNKKLYEEVINIKPDITLILKGQLIESKTIIKIKKHSDTKVVLWCYDQAVRYPNVIKSGKYYDIFYSFEPTDVESLKKYNINCKFLPMAYDSSYYTVWNMGGDYLFLFATYAYTRTYAIY